MAQVTTSPAPATLKRVTVESKPYVEPVKVDVTEGYMLHPPYADWDEKRLSFEPPKELKVDGVSGLYMSPALYDYPDTPGLRGRKTRLVFGYPYEGDAICYSRFGITDQLEEMTPEQKADHAAGKPVVRKTTGKKIIRITMPPGVTACDNLRAIMNTIYKKGMEHLNAYGTADGGKRVLRDKYLMNVERPSEDVNFDNPYESFMYPVSYMTKDVPHPKNPDVMVKRADYTAPCSIAASVMLPEDGSKLGPDGKPRKSPGSRFIDDNTETVDMKNLEDKGFYHSPEISVSLFMGAKAKVKFTLKSSIIFEYMVENTVGRIQAIEGRKKAGISTADLIRQRANLHAKDSMADETDKPATSEAAKLEAEAKAAEAAENARLEAEAKAAEEAAKIEAIKADIEAKTRAKLEEEIRLKLEAEAKAKKPSRITRPATPDKKVRTARPPPKKMVTPEGSTESEEGSD